MNKVSLKKFFVKNWIIDLKQNVKNKEIMLQKACGVYPYLTLRVVSSEVIIIFSTCGIMSLYADLAWFYRICNITRGSTLVWTFQSKLKYKKHCSPAFVLRQLYVVNESGINNHSTKGTNTTSLKMNDLRFHCGIVSIFNYILMIIW